ncbi:MAG: hypothetical protein H0V40_10995 [Actinobacteria bacterium]|nr:hypothetical protein [Actinomycetota bacterium]
MRISRRWRRALALGGSLALAAALATGAAGGGGAGFKTSAAPMLAGVAAGVEVEPIITVGERLRSGYRFESLPDGISLRGRGAGRVDLYVNHETSLVPFPVPISDFTNAMVSRLTLSRQSRGVLQGSYVIPSSANYQRFCSNFLAGREHGFERPLLFTNEEATDLVNRTGTAWPAGPGAEQAGVVVAYDIRSGRYRPIYGMGRHNHENSVALPGFGHPVVLSGDDTFSAPASQLYLYSADDGDDVWRDRGKLLAFKSSDPDVNDYGDLGPEDTTDGSFVPVPREVARGDQTALESWSNANGVFQFIRVEDIAYDREYPFIVYFADTGEPRAVADPATGRLRRGPAGTTGPFPNGRVFQMVLDPDDPTEVLSLSVLIDGDARGAASAGALDLIHNPDNLETTERSLLIQEDPGSQNQYAASNPNGTTARIWRYDLETEKLTVVARVDQSQDPAARQGAWESSGIVDASEAFGPGAFLLDVQAGTLVLDREVTPTVTYEREGGQLLLVRIPER